MSLFRPFLTRSNFEIVSGKKTQVLGLCRDLRNMQAWRGHWVESWRRQHSRPLAVLFELKTERLIYNRAEETTRLKITLFVEILISHLLVRQPSPAIVSVASQRPKPMHQGWPPNEDLSSEHLRHQWKCWLSLKNDMFAIACIVVLEPPEG